MSRAGSRQLPTEDYHLTPGADFREHELSPHCWCKPTRDAEYPDVWVHNAMDQRELYETGQRMLA